MLGFLQKGHRDFINQNLKLEKNHFNNNKAKILIDFFDDYPVIFLFSSMKKYLQKKYKADFEYFTFNDWHNVQISSQKSFFQNFKSIIRKFTTFRVLNKIFRSFGVREGLIINYNNKKFFKIAELKAEKILSKLKKPENVYSIKFKNFNLGKYIYQSYLRDFNEPTLKLNDKRLYETIKKSLLIFLNIEEYFKNNSVKILIPSHTVYLYYGIITEYAYKKKCKVFRIKQVGWRDTQSTDLIHVDKRISEAPPTNNYKKIFNNFSKKQKKKFWNVGKKHLNYRFKGKKEPNLSGNLIMYHNKKSRINFKNNNKNIMLFLPCFFDGPGRHSNLLFPDFYQWTEFMLENAKKTKFEWFIKPHPSGLPGNDKIIKEFKDKYSNYKNLNFISKTTSNKYLINHNFNSLFCHHGNVVPEFASKNIPVVVACSDYSSSFDFSIRAKSKKHLAKLIDIADKINFKPNKKHIYEYIFMHFIYFMGYKKNNRIFNRNFETEISKFHNTHKANISNHKFFSLLKNEDYTFSENKIINLLKKINI